MELKRYKHCRSYLAPRSSLLAPRGFTLIELLVVITIIGILAALIVVAAVGALKNAQRTRTKAELNQIANAFDEYKNKTTAYPPNCQSDDNDLGKNGPLVDEATTFNDLKRHMRQAFPRHQESDDLLRLLMGMVRDSNKNDPNYSKAPLSGGMTAGEALVFWLSGFSADPKYPISGDGGPSYAIPAYGPNSTNKTLDPVENRGKGAGAYPFDVTRLGPRGADGYFDDTDARYIEYTDPKGQKRRINFWQYKPAKSDQPYLYFDTSRHPVGDVGSGNTFTRIYDPPAATLYGLNRTRVDVYAFKKPSESASSTTPQPALQFINPDKFQVIHCGIPNTWDTDNFVRMAVTLGGPNPPPNCLLFPTGPFTGDIAEAITNFTTETKIEDAAK
jgi:prepilin-type N-terminal cleavage/methylation domain-containing protein